MIIGSVCLRSDLAAPNSRSSINSRTTWESERKWLFQCILFVIHLFQYNLLCRNYCQSNFLYWEMPLFLFRWTTEITANNNFNISTPILHFYLPKSSPLKPLFSEYGCWPKLKMLISPRAPEKSFSKYQNFLWGITELMRIVKKQTNYPTFTNNTTFLYTESPLCPFVWCLSWSPGTVHLKPLKFHQW